MLSGHSEILAMDKRISQCLTQKTLLEMITFLKNQIWMTMEAGNGAGHVTAFPVQQQHMQGDT